MLLHHAFFNSLICIAFVIFSKSATITLVIAVVHNSCADFCISLFDGLSKYSINRLDKGKNIVAHIVTNSSHFSHKTPNSRVFILVSNILYRTNFKICIHRTLSLKNRFIYANFLRID